MLSHPRPKAEAAGGSEDGGAAPLLHDLAFQNSRPSEQPGNLVLFEQNSSWSQAGEKLSLDAKDPAGMEPRIGPGSRGLDGW